MRKLTDGEEHVYEKIKEFININGYSPTIRELCKTTRYTSPATICSYLMRLRDKEYISYVDNKNRTIRIIGG